MSNRTHRTITTFNLANSARISAVLICAAIILISVTLHVSAQSDKSGNVRTSITKVTNFAGTATIPQAGATLSRNSNGVFGTISTSQIPAGHVVTLWWAVFNNPQYCVTATCNAPDLNNPAVNGSAQLGGGYIVGSNGRADFSGYLAVGDNTGFTILPPFPNMPDPSDGIVDTRRAIIHMVIRDHGLASSDPAILNAQLTTFVGGCTTPTSCANTQAAIFLP